MWIYTDSTDLQSPIITQEFLGALLVKEVFEEESKVGKWLYGGSTDYSGRRDNTNASLRQQNCAGFERFNFEFSTSFLSADLRWHLVIHSKRRWAEPGCLFEHTIIILHARLWKLTNDFPYNLLNCIKCCNRSKCDGFTSSKNIMNSTKPKLTQLINSPCTEDSSPSNIIIHFALGTVWPLCTTKTKVQVANKTNLDFRQQ